MVSKIVAWIKLGRFIFLTGGFVMYGLGAAVALYQNVAINWTVYLIGQSVVTSTQLMVHYSNDYFDHEADALNTTYTPWSGGSRVLPDNQLPRTVALITALILAGIALLGTLILATTEETGPLTIPLLLSSIGLSWAYSSPPVRLHSRSLGEITATLIVAGFTPFLGYYLQTRELTTTLILAIIPLLLLQFNMLLSVHLPDVEGDRLAGKKTLVVQLGTSRTRQLYRLLLALAYASVPILLLVGLPTLCASAIVLPMPLGLFLWWQTSRPIPARRLSVVAFLSIVLLMSTAGLELGAFLLLSQ
jgi:1,4-dihydroxy-2-naphthoate octaprenyltransferase